MSYLKDAMRDWEVEVDNVAARLIREGTPPYDAADQAREIVSRRRARGAKENGVDEILAKVWRGGAPKQ